MDLFDNIIVALSQPQRLVNIGGTVRALKNMGLRRLRLVRPAEYDPAAIVGIAHRSDDLLAATTIYDNLDEALADAGLGRWHDGAGARRCGAHRHAARAGARAAGPRR